MKTNRNTTPPNPRAILYKQPLKQCHKALGDISGLRAALEDIGQLDKWNLAISTLAHAVMHLYTVGDELYAEEDGITRSPETVKLWTEEKADRVETYINALPFFDSGIEVKPSLIAAVIEMQRATKPTQAATRDSNQAPNL